MARYVKRPNHYHFRVTERTVTIVTDASYCSFSGAAAWAAWLVCNGQRFTKAALFKPDSGVDSPTLAETYAILNGIAIANKLYNPLAYHIITDCTTAIDILTYKSKQHLTSRNPNKPRTSVRPIRDKLIELTGDKYVSYAHVKAHKAVVNNRTYCNKWCDAEAGRLMKDQREQLGYKRNGEVTEKTEN